MSNLIQLLPDHVANQIAAGEVIQRPASVIKELVENAIDAGATEIKVVVKDAGKTLIQVIDNGCGMNEIDARMSFERHATSKIRSADDIFKIFTKGFRGEALASIAAVAQVDLKTRQQGSELGTHLMVEATAVKDQQPVQCPPGSIFSVKNLFFNVPARRNFLKSDAIELKHIIEEFLRVALVHNEVSFRLMHNEQDIFVLPAGNHRQRVVGIFGKSYNERLVPIEQETTLVNIAGFVCKPEHSKKTRGEQYLFVNNRYIRSNYLSHSISSCYDDLVEKGSYPSYFIFLQVDPASIDINIHPTKTEIKFLDEKSLYAILHAAVKQSLGMYNIKPSIDFESITDMNLTPLGRNTEIKVPGVKVNPNYNPFAKQSSGYRPSDQPLPASNNIPARQWEDLIRIQQEFSMPLEEEVRQIEASQPSPAKEIPEIAENVTYMQVNGSYILANIKSGLMLIDQQRAHERVLFEHYLRLLKAQPGMVQTRMFPEQVTLSPTDYALLTELMPMLENAGVMLENFGNNTIVVNGLPAEANDLNPEAFVELLLEQIKNFRHEVRLDNQEQLALSLARSCSIKRGKKLSHPEMDQLVHSLFACELPHYTPRGKAVIVTFTSEEIVKKFA